MKPSGINCPHCREPFNEDQIKRLWAEYCGRKTSIAKSKAAVANGKKGGRPVTYFQDVQNAIPLSISQVYNDIRQKPIEWRQQCNFEVELTQTKDPVKDGFYLKCDNILWHVRWNPANSHVEAFQDGRQIVGYNNVNNSAKTSANRLVKDIYRTKLQSMPEDYSDFISWFKQLARR